MFSRWLRLFILSVLCAPTFVVRSASQPQDAPYIYYYSDRLNAFVIERADGTDKHLLGDSIMPPVQKPAFGYYIEGPGWSPSGRWFAWTGSMVQYGNATGLRPYTVSTSNRPLSVLQDFDNAKIAWHSKTDKLLIASQDILSDGLRTRVAIADAATNTLIVYKDSRSTEPIRAEQTAWLSNGYAIAQYGLVEDTSYDFLLGFVVIDPGGKATDQTFKAVLQPTNSSVWDGSIAFSSTGNIAYQRDGAVIIENLITGTRNSHEIKTITNCNCSG